MLPARHSRHVRLAGRGAPDVKSHHSRGHSSIKVMGKGAKERMVPIGSAARTAIVRYLDQRGEADPDAPTAVFLAGPVFLVDDDVEMTRPAPVAIAELGAEPPRGGSPEASSRTDSVGYAFGWTQRKKHARVVVGQPECSTGRRSGMRDCPRR